MSLHPDIKIGSILKDNDPRQEGRTVTVDEVGKSRVLYISPKNGQRNSISLKRIHYDGKARKTGFSLVREGGAA